MTLNKTSYCLLIPNVHTYLEEPNVWENRAATSSLLLLVLVLGALGKYFVILFCPNDWIKLGRVILVITRYNNIY